MKKNYDFSKAVKNPYAKRLKRQLTIRLDHDTIEYFKKTAEELAIPYQTLINMYLRECATRKSVCACIGSQKRGNARRGLTKSDHALP